MFWEEKRIETFSEKEIRRRVIMGELRVKRRCRSVEEKRDGAEGGPQHECGLRKRGRGF